MPPSWMRSLRDHVPQAAAAMAASRIPDVLQHADWSGSLTNTHHSPTGNFNEGILAALALPGEVSAIAFEPVAGYLAVGTSQGTVHIFGSAPVQIALTLRPAVKVRHLAFRSGTGLLVCIDEKDNMSIYDLERPDPQIRASNASSSNHYRASSASTGNSLTGSPHPDTPQRVGIHTVRNKVMAIELSPAHSHLFLGLRDGTVDAYDLDRLCPSPYRVPNLWWEEEEILRKSGVPDAPNRRHVPLIIDIKSHPKDLNQLLLAYEGGAILLDIKERAVFAMGHEDGCISFWHAKEDDKPITVRTLDALDVEKPSASVEALERPRPPREPIFKLAWSGFPEKSWMEMGRESAAAWQSPQPGSASRASQDGRPAGAGQGQGQGHGHGSEDGAAAPTKGTILTVLGGAVEGRDPPSLYAIHLPPYAAPMSLWGGGGDGGANANKLRQSLRQSLQSTAESTYRTSSLVEDFVLLPKLSPHFGGAFDPMGVLVLLAADPSLPTLPPPAAARGLACYSFPPRLPTWQAAPSDVPNASPQLDAVPAPVQASSLPQRELDLPLPLTLAGAGAILGAKFATMAPHAYRKLVGLEDATGLNQRQQDESDLVAMRSSQDPRRGPLHLHGGKASASVSGDGPETIPDLARSSKFRILITWHLDGSVRFHDASPHLLLMGDVDAADAAADPNVPPRVWLKRGFPSPLPHLTISTRALLRHEQMAGHPTFDRIRGRAKVQDVQLAPEVLEVGISLSTGQLLQYRFDFAKLSETRAIQEEVEREIQEEQQQQQQQGGANFMIPPVTSSRSEGGSSSVASPRPLADPSSSGLDQEMANAMRELDTGDQGQHVQPSGPTAPPMQGLPSRSSLTDAGIMHDVDLAGAGTSTPASHSRTPSQGGPGAPPPRPKRDPKRLSFRFGGRDRESSAGSGAGGVTMQPSDSISSIPEQGRPPPTLPTLPTPPPAEPRPHLEQAAAEEVTYLGHLAEWHCDGFKPNLMIDPMRGEITAFAISDIGFVAVACGTVLAVLDLRGPELILREGFGDQADFAKQARGDVGGVGGGSAREARKMLEAEAKSPISALTFGVCRVADDPSLAPRLVVSRDNGYTTVWTLQRTLDMWMVERTSGHKLDDFAALRRLQVLDVGGNVCPALPNELQRALREQEHGPIGGSAADLPDSNLALAFTDRGISLRAGITGPVVAKADVGERVLGGGVVERGSEKVAAVVTSSSIRIYTLPRLQQITRLQRHHRELGETAGSFASPNLTLWPKPAAGGRTMPLHPGAVGSAAGVATSIAGWFGTKTSGVLSIGDQFDAALAGPNRPDPPKLGDPLPPRDFRVRMPDVPATSTPPAARHTSSSSSSVGAGPGSGRTDAGKARAVAEETQQAAGYGYQNIDLLKARGAMMSGIEEGLTTLERGASDFVKGTRDMAIKSAAKDKLNKFLF
ncbi:uncharacterized protein PFL1_05610 [Pseudozyma flocculosa PF-1]|uniref:Lethal giant larvae (Lgl)-like C-terminal domain-containing protein n=1 Tax=Pseudozyma flocculosa PF-1 TaxID=1277687 RepID=A0A061H4T5_9BASI|nr:uncharacterized protein PFL1_05610 [Pseudozyma flocculosa PF-1]EPQ26975.1 hypothetical protein PFL1_05610 [Pseudozyma flocculosa PF-1]